VWRWLWRWSLLHCIGLAAVIVYTIVSAAIGAPFVSWSYLVGFFLVLLLYALPSSQLRAFRCPRCGERFLWGLGFGIFFQSHCNHCKLPKYAEHADNPQEI
jgi:hypothetical protein